ncbi:MULTISPECIES: YpzG family protein [Bacillaceae]|uniref:YpzG family protein n=1 Tax=Bacillaceae TaxID=186817 RepID=UPI0009FF4B33|nr:MULTISPECIES: YpzG family protein [Bacillaceae]MDT8860975.1 YpzG family protein [Alkalihalobacillus sp. MEB130]
MGKRSMNFQAGQEYKSPFDSPRANPKHASKQIGGETQMSQTDIKVRLHRKAEQR